jgi:hypothetical protein
LFKEIQKKFNYNTVLLRDKENPWKVKYLFRRKRKFEEMHLLKALLEVSLYFLKFIEYKMTTGFGGSEVLFSLL